MNENFGKWRDNDYKKYKEAIEKLLNNLDFLLDTHQTQLSPKIYDKILEIKDKGPHLIHSMDLLPLAEYECGIMEEGFFNGYPEDEYAEYVAMTIEEISSFYKSVHDLKSELIPELVFEVEPDYKKILVSIAVGLIIVILIYFF